MTIACSAQRGSRNRRPYGRRRQRSRAPPTYLGSDGALLRRDGAQWSVAFEGPIEDIFGRSRTEIFTVGGVDDVFIGKGVGWTAHTIDPGGTCDTSSVWGRGEADVYLLCRASPSAEGNAVCRYR